MSRSCCRHRSHSSKHCRRQTKEITGPQGQVHKEKIIQVQERRSRQDDKVPYMSSECSLGGPEQCL